MVMEVTHSHGNALVVTMVEDLSYDGLKDIFDVDLVHCKYDEVAAVEAKGMHGTI